MSARRRLFDDLYRADPDPWDLATSGYERRKHAETLRALPRARFRHALELGASIGVLTRGLARRADLVSAVDVSPVALAAARARCRGLPVRTLAAEVPGDWPAGRFDLVVLSELLYFLEREEIVRLAGRVAASASAGAAVVLVDWLGPCDRPLDGDAAADVFLAAAARRGFVSRRTLRRPLYRIDVAARRPLRPGMGRALSARRPPPRAPRGRRGPRRGLPLHRASTGGGRMPAPRRSGGPRRSR